MPDSILTGTKQSLGITEEVTNFDAELTMHINSVFADLNQLGIGPDNGYQMANKDDTWDELIGEDSRYNQVKSYVFMRVRMLFDPPSLGYLITAYEKMIKEAEWRINTAREDIVNPAPPDPDPGEVLDGGEL